MKKGFQEKARYGWILFSIIVCILSYLVAPGLGLAGNPRIVFSIMLLAGALWFTEAVPLHVTGLLIAFLLILTGVFSSEQAFAPFFDPVIVLLLGGFVMARAMQKHGLDKQIAYAFIQKFGTRPGPFLFGLMLVTAFLSMWMTNTATTALILPIAVVVLTRTGLQPMKSKYSKALVLGVAFSATIGGIGTLVGSTPNPMAASFLADRGIELGFVDWMAYAFPLVVIMLPIAWLVLMKIFGSEVNELKVEEKVGNITHQHKLVLTVFLVTIALWLTSSFHGVSSPTVAVVPILLLYFLNLLSVEDFSKINWAALILFGGGLSLGSAISSSGLDVIFADFLKALAGGQPYFTVLLLIIGVSILLTLVSSNTATAAVLIPVVIPLAGSLGGGMEVFAVLAAIGVSLDFIVPVGTPPSTIAYSSGYVRVKDMAKAGIILAVIGSLVLACMAHFYWPLL